MFRATKGKREAPVKGLPATPDADAASVQHARIAGVQIGVRVELVDKIRGLRKPRESTPFSPHRNTPLDRWVVFRRGPVGHRTHSVIASCLAPVVHGSSDPIELRARTSLGLSKPARSRLPYTPSVTQSPIPLVDLRQSLVRSSMDRMLRRCGVSAWQVQNRHR
jgi:hypothetical protein